ncbi:GntR family transcriptional regulator [Listeria costaricensis]|uniref:GntR family transcriptional regulator n=1 Tax=Listeria costaricensis TaxID=2026604 RepID=UPI0013C50AFC|nr:GntR family transcriptional regulator [Listeria costaricensis]
MAEAAPKYELIANDLRRKILERAYEVNEQLPQEAALCKAYNASRITIRKAMDILVNEGLIYKRRGSGSFVKDITENQTAGQKRSLEVVEGNDITTEIIDFAVITSPEVVTEKLKISSFDFVYDIRRVRKKAGVAVAVEQSYMPIQTVQGMRIDVLGQSLYTYMENELGLIPQSTHRLIRAVYAGKKVGKLLNVDEKHPVLEIEQTVYLNDGRPFEYSLIRLKSEEYELQNIVVV